jgi:hypothetical protein
MPRRVSDSTVCRQPEGLQVWRVASATSNSWARRKNTGTLVKLGVSLALQGKGVSRWGLLGQFYQSDNSSCYTRERVWCGVDRIVIEEDILWWEPVCEARVEKLSNV